MIAIHLHATTDQATIFQNANQKELAMYDRSDGLMRGSRQQRAQEVLNLQESDWDFDTLLGIIQGMLDHAEDVRLAAMETLLEMAGQNKGPMSLTPVSVIEYFMFTFNACTKTAQRVFRFLVENSGIPGANEAIEWALLSDVRNEDFEKFVAIVVEAEKSEFLKILEGKKLSKTKAKILKNALNR
jgi:hypothetical protein